MGKKDPRVDGYIQNAADFARPILSHLRKLVHTACPEVLESIKWNFPHFEHKGVLCSMASFKQHCVFGFWKGDLVLGKQPKAKEAMGHFGRITSLADLPKDDVMIGYIREAVRLNEAGVKRSLPSRAKRRPVVVPDYFAEVKEK